MKFPPEGSRGKWHEGIIEFEPEIPYKDYLSSNKFFCKDRKDSRIS